MQSANAKCKMRMPNAAVMCMDAYGCVMYIDADSGMMCIDAYSCVMCFDATAA